MKELEARIKEDARVLGADILKVDSFLNHQIDPKLMQAMGAEFARLFKDQGITKVITVEASGIAPAVMAGLNLDVPVVFARKSKSRILSDDAYTADVYSYTKQSTNQIRIDKRFLSADDNVLLIDDFLANGQALLGMKALADDAGATIVGAGIVIEKSFQPGRQAAIEAGLTNIHSLAKIAAFEDGQVVFDEAD
ncbi:Adenine/guanine phosphoribosyltransferase or related PRPP-binding protein (Apt) [Fructobacillus evanidus]|uniref:xanthine phosphoribosyltransferase n=1 Tax=Fructobacillus evanidus TaxID=3064281 RepID=UPI002D978BCD|nr:Adenine/guanine phosphoribosyltransferase or related PRPP-binding protein (Apt) [Fructobacillus sp. LMG 32999]CAK1238176.1 Adenine/guanine phosphoribosyltransferase or related PRPP-binding protein (Apt) [Fructobacillus sp. LMG 32999]CAK1244012.1 Adenine/guanine phosphoribosyltransferase or related PRPP-binding protein (Apt) [Fructobacillus sp. LMG 32999]CAK1244350.1 Adenine/guanine phosphoribosyltransferase or related PRPP-binding protein (Apt) [Fructobacillus sp. LMG 32999]CAK1245783.1 Aden